MIASVELELSWIQQAQLYRNIRVGTIQGKNNRVEFRWRKTHRGNHGK